MNNHKDINKLQELKKFIQDSSTRGYKDKSNDRDIDTIPRQNTANISKNNKSNRSINTDKFYMDKLVKN